MKSLVIAAALLAIGVSTADAQYRPAPPPPTQQRVYVPVPPPPPPRYIAAEHPYPQRYHNICQEKAHRLADYQRHAAADGYISPRERATIRILERDLNRTCGRYRR